MNSSLIGVFLYNYNFIYFQDILLENNKMNQKEFL